MAIRRYNTSTGLWESFGSPQVNPASIGAAAATHASQHSSAGLDPVTPASIGAVSSSGGQVTSASTNSGVVRNIFTSTSTPTGGIDGDVWLKYV